VVLLLPDERGRLYEECPPHLGSLATPAKDIVGLPRSRLPVGVYPTHSARRISTQRSCFTIHGSDADGLERLAGESDAHIVKVIVLERQRISDEFVSY